MTEIQTLNPQNYRVGTPPDQVEYLPAPELSPGAQAIVTELQARSPADMLEGSGRKRRLTEQMRTIARDSFFTYLADAGSPEELAIVLDQLKAHTDTLSGDLRIAMRRFTNALNMRLTHYNAGHEVSGNSSPVSLQFLEENLPDVAEVEEELSEPEPLELPSTSSESDKLLTELLQQPVEVIPETPPAAAPIQEVAPVETSSPYDALYKDPMFSEGPLAVERPIQEAIVQRVSEASETLKNIREQHQLPWYRRLFVRIPSDVQHRLDENEKVLLRLFPRMPEGRRYLFARQFAEVFPTATANQVSAGELASVIRAMEVTVGQNSYSRPQLPGERLPGMNRRQFLATGAATALTLGAAFAGGTDTGRSLMKSLLGLDSQPLLVSANTIQEAAQAASEAQARAIEEQNRLRAAAEEQTRLKAEVKRVAAEKAVQEQKAEAQLRNEGRMATERTRMEEMRKQEQIAEIQKLPRIEALGSGVVLFGEQGTYTGDYSEPTESIDLSDEVLQDLAEMRETLLSKEKETEGHIAIELTGLVTIQGSNVDKKDFSGALNEEPEMVTIPSENPIHPETSGWIYDPKKDVILIRLQASLVGHGNTVSESDKAGGMYFEVPRKQALDLAKNSRFGISSATWFSWGPTKMTNMRIGFKYIEQQLVDVEHVSMLDAIKLESSQVLADEYVDWDAFVDGRVVKADGSGVCADVARTFGTGVRALEAAKVNYTRKSSGHSPAHAYHTVGTDPVLQWRDPEEHNRQWIQDTTVYTENSDKNPSTVRVDATIDIHDGSKLTIKPTILVDKPHTVSDSKMIIIIEASVKKGTV